MTAIDLRAWAHMPAGAKRAIDMIKDEEVKKDVLRVRAELVEMAATSTSKYLEAYDMILTSLKEQLGTPDEEICEMLGEGLDEMSRLAQHYDPVLRRHLEGKK
jgi:hypothetical protein